MNRLKELREEHKLSLEQLSRYTKIDKSTLSRLENGQREFRESRLKTLSLYFGVNAEYILGWSNTRNTDTKE